MKGTTRSATAVSSARIAPASISGLAEPAAQGIVMHKQPLDLFRQRVEVGEVDQADGAAADLVLVGRADPAAGRADLGARCGGLLAQEVELAMQRQDERHVVGDPKRFRRDDDPLAFQLVDLGDQRMRIEHHAIADDRELSRPHHAGGQQAQLEGDAVDDERVPGIVAALEADDDVGALRQPVDDLSLALVAPLRADDHHIRHVRTSFLHQSSARSDACRGPSGSGRADVPSRPAGAAGHMSRGGGPHVRFAGHVPDQPTIRICSARGPCAPRMSVCSMSAERDGPVTRFTVRGSLPGP